MLNRWMFTSFDATPRGLALYRICYALFVFFFAAPGHDLYSAFARLGGLPDVFFLPPPGPMALFSGFPPVAFFEGLLLLLNLGLAAVLFGYRTRAASLLVAALFLVGYGFSYSLGKINHNLLFVLVPLVMAGSGWGSAWSLDALAGRNAAGANAAPRARNWTLTLLALLVGFGMFTAGFSKLIGGWLDPATHATQGHFFRQYFLNGRQDLLAPVFLTFESKATPLFRDLFWKTLDYATLLFEVGFLAAVAHPRATRLFMALAVFFHVGTALMLNIAFIFNLVAYAAFLPWPRMARSVRRRLPASGAAAVRRALQSTAWAGPALCAMTGAAFYAAGSPLLLLDRLDVLASDLTLREGLALVLAAGLVLALVAARLRRLLTVRKGEGAPASV